MRADVGSCRKALPSMNPSGWALWPNVANDDWCGEHAPRVESSDRPDFREVEAARGCLDPESPDASV